MVDNRTPEVGGDPVSGKRRDFAREIREQAAVVEHAAPDGFVITTANDDEVDFGDGRPASFTKGLDHDDQGFVTADYQAFVDAINKFVPNDFEGLNGNDLGIDFDSTVKSGCCQADLGWRGWESPRTGGYYDLQGADANAIGMAPAPALGSSELVGEMAEVYAMAMLRDVPFSKIEDGTGVDTNTGIDVQTVLDALKQIPYFASDPGGDIFGRRRRSARLSDPTTYSQNAPPQDGELTSPLLFRGSGPGAKVGPSVSQFMVVGNNLDDIAVGSDPERSSSVTPFDGYISYGSQLIDQRGRVFLPHLDYMTNWNAWLDVQKGGDFRGAHVFDRERRFLATPRHLATYVRFDALYQAYLNGCLLLLGANYPTQPGFPEQPDRARTGFASFGGPHVLSLVTEVATRCLKQARRQKFNFHRRARPEKISGLLSVGQAIAGGALGDPSAGYTAATQAQVESMLDELGGMKDLIAHHNALRENGAGSNADERPICSSANPDWLAGANAGNNLLLAMAFPEGSPMHPAYAAGHATVAGGCVTMLKAFFRTLDDDHNPIPWYQSGLPAVVSNDEGTELQSVSGHGMTVEGELNKLAANISIARNMAGVHYYSDYYDSLRMGERVTVSILVEQALTYDEPFEIKFRSFDGDFIKIKAPGKPAGKFETDDLIEIQDAGKNDLAYRDWWFRHMI